MSVRAIHLHSQFDIEYAIVGTQWFNLKGFCLDDYIVLKCVLLHIFEIILRNLAVNFRGVAICCVIRALFVF